MSTVSIIGSGRMAAAIGGLAARAGHTVEVTSRHDAHAQTLAEQVGAGATTGVLGTRRILGWEPAQPGLLDDLDHGHCFPSH